MIIIGCDHTGYDLKNNIINKFKENNIKYLDVSNNEVIDYLDDYPDIAKLITKEVLKSTDNLGIAICGTGLGISIACNKVKGIRAGVLNNIEIAKLSKEHNNLNVMCLGAKQNYINDLDSVKNIINTFIDTKFEGGRHQRRIDKIANIERNLGN